jgi:hypothetical protein
MELYLTTIICNANYFQAIQISCIIICIANCRYKLQILNANFYTFSSRKKCNYSPSRRKVQHSNQLSYRVDIRDEAIIYRSDKFRPNLPSDRPIYRRLPIFVNKYSQHSNLGQNASKT